MTSDPLQIEPATLTEPEVSMVDSAVEFIVAGEQNLTTDAGIGNCVCDVVSSTSDAREVSMYTCGACCDTFTTLCLLHKHLKTHGSAGSYHFNHNTNTAYPKFDVSLSFVQTDLSILFNESVIVKSPETDSSVPSSKVKEFRKRKIKNEQVDRKKKGCPKTRSTKPPEAPLKIRLKKEAGKRIKYTQDTEDNKYYKEGLKVKRRNKSSEKVKKTKVKTSRKMKKSSSTEIDETLKDKSLKDDGSEMSTVEQEQSVAYEIGNPTQTQQDIVEDKGDIPVQGELNGHKINEASAENNDKLDEIAEAMELEVKEELDGEDTETDSVQMEFLERQNKGSEKSRKQKMNKLMLKREPGKNVKEAREKKKLERKRQEDIYQSCEICNEIMLQKKIKGHMVMHTGEKSFVCEICGQAYAKNSNLYRHKITHREVKPFKCSFCPAQFCRKKDYTYHMNSHKGYRPHVCNVCDKRFLTNKGLIQHQENIHMGITKFQCDLCERRFFKKSGLYAHRATHFDATMECQYCDRKFRDKCGLNKHERTHTGKKHYQCHVCEHAFNQCTPYYQHMEKRHDMDRGSIKDIMKIVMEAKKRDGGQKVDLFRVPDNIDQIVAHLKLEEDIVKYNKVFLRAIEDKKTYSNMEVNTADVITKTEPQQHIVTENLPLVINCNETSAEAMTTIIVTDNIMQHPMAGNVVLDAQSGEAANSVLSLHALEAMKLPLLQKTEDEIKKLCSAQALETLHSQPHIPIPHTVTDSVLNYSINEQAAQSTSLMNLEPVKNLLHTSGHPKQKMKLLSQYNAEYQQQLEQKPILQQPPPETAQILQAKVPATTHPVASYTHAGLQQAAIDPLTDAYTTSDFLERILQGH